MPHILFFKKQVEDDPYRQLFSTKGWTSACIPVLDTEYPAREELLSRFRTPERYSGLILTSARAVEALKEYEVSDLPEFEVWKTLPVYVVGPSTRKHIQTLGFRYTRGETGDARSLGTFIANDPVTSPWLFLSGDKRRDELPDLLTEASVPFEECTVYRTLGMASLGLDALNPPDWVVFFSPSGVQTVRNAWPRHWTEVSLAAIGATTASAIEQSAWHPQAVASHPTPEALWQAVAAISPGIR